MEISLIWEDNVLQLISSLSSLKDTSAPPSPFVEIKDVTISDVLSLSSYDMMLSVVEDDVCSVSSFSTMGMTELVNQQVDVKNDEVAKDDDFDVKSFLMNGLIFWNLNHLRMKRNQ